MPDIASDTIGAVIDTVHSGFDSVEGAAKSVLNWSGGIFGAIVDSIDVIDAYKNGTGVDVAIQGAGAIGGTIGSTVGGILGITVTLHFFEQTHPPFHFLRGQFAITPPQHAP